MGDIEGQEEYFEEPVEGNDGYDEEVDRSDVDGGGDEIFGQISGDPNEHGEHPGTDGKEALSGREQDDILDAKPDLPDKPAGGDDPVNEVVASLRKEIADLKAELTGKGKEEHGKEEDAAQRFEFSFESEEEYQDALSDPEAMQRVLSRFGQSLMTQVRERTSQDMIQKVFEHVPTAVTYHQQQQAVRQYAQKAHGDIVASPEAKTQMQSALQFVEKMYPNYTLRQKIDSAANMTRQWMEENGLLEPAREEPPRPPLQRTPPVRQKQRWPRREQPRPHPAPRAANRPPATSQQQKDYDLWKGIFTA